MSESTPTNLAAICRELRAVPRPAIGDLSSLRYLSATLRAAARSLQEDNAAWCGARPRLMSCLEAPPAGLPFADGAAAAEALERSGPEPADLRAEEAERRWTAAAAVVDEDDIASELALRHVLAADPAHGLTHDALAALYRRRHEAAHSAGADDAARWEALLAWHDRGAHADWLAAEATIDIESEPPGAIVLAEREGGESVALGRTPVSSARLAEGAWTLLLRGEGGATARVPVLLPRCSHLTAGKEPIHCSRCIHLRVILRD